MSQPWDGKPDAPERDGCHWVTHPNDIDAPNGKMAIYWNGHGRWLMPGMARPIPPEEMTGYLYHGPCLPPEEVNKLILGALSADRKLQRYLR